MLFVTLRTLGPARAKNATGPTVAAATGPARRSNFGSAAAAALRCVPIANRKRESSPTDHRPAP